MNEAFNKWWNEDLLTEDNPYVDGSYAYWAWEGWCAGVKAEREACKNVCDDLYRKWTYETDDFVEPPDALDCKRAIKSRGETK